MHHQGGDSQNDRPGAAFRLLLSILHCFVVRETNLRVSCAAASQVPYPSVDPDAPSQILVTNLDYDEHKGRIAIGRVSGGKLVRLHPLPCGRACAPPA